MFGANEAVLISATPGSFPASNSILQRERERFLSGSASEGCLWSKAVYASPFTQCDV